MIKNEKNDKTNEKMEKIAFFFGGKIFAPLEAKMMKHDETWKMIKQWKIKKCSKKWLKNEDDKINVEKMMNAMITKKIKNEKNYFDLAQSVAASFSKKNTKPLTWNKAHNGDSYRY